MKREALKIHAQLLIDAVNLVEACEKNLENIEGMTYYVAFNQRAEKVKDITEAKEQLKLANDTLARQAKYISIELSEIKL